MKLFLSRLLAPDTASLEHLAALAQGLRDAVDRVAQVMAASSAHSGDADDELTRIDTEATARHMALLTSLRSAFITPLPRQDLYVLADAMNHTVEKVCNAGDFIITTGQYRFPSESLDILELLGRQADLCRDATGQFRDLDELEETWIQLQRMSKQAERLMTRWIAGMTGDLMQRDYNRQRATAHALEGAMVSMRHITVRLGSILVRES